MRPLEELTEATLASEGVLVPGDGRTRIEYTVASGSGRVSEAEVPVRLMLAEGRSIAVGSQRGHLIAARILGTSEGIIDDYALGPDEWAVR